MQMLAASVWLVGKTSLLKVRWNVVYWNKYKNRQNVKVKQTICFPCFTEDYLQILELFRTSFLFWWVYDVLPTPTSLHRLAMREEPLCCLPSTTLLGGERRRIARFLLARGAIDGAMGRSSKHWLKYLKKESKTNSNPAIGSTNHSVHQLRGETTTLL